MELLKEKLLASAKLRTRVVEIEGEKYTVREVGAVEFAAYGALLKTDRIKATASLVHDCLVDENGAKILTLEEAIEVVGSARVSMQIVNAIMEVSGFGEKEPDAS